MRKHTCWCHLSLAFDGSVYVTNKEQRSTETDCAEHKEEAVADAGHVAEEE